MSNRTGIHCYVPKKGRMVELWLSREDRSIAARKPLGLGAAVIVGSDERYCEAIVRTGDGGVKVKMATRAASKLAEGCAWVGAIMALAYVGEVGAAAIGRDAANVKKCDCCGKVESTRNWDGIYDACSGCAHCQSLGMCGSEPDEGERFEANCCHGGCLSQPAGVVRERSMSSDRIAREMAAEGGA